MDLAIYGAQGYALGVYEAIRCLYPERNIVGFLVTKMGNNATELCGLLVTEIEPFAENLSDAEKKEIQILIATPENVQDEIEETVEKYGFSNHIRLTSELWDEMMQQYYSKAGQFSPIQNLPTGESRASLHIYMAKSHKDRPLKNTIVMRDYMWPIQVGAANTDEVIADIRDDNGENISKKNGNYCELTGLYWVWKNVLCIETNKDEYYGFAQYRRTLMLSDEDLLRLKQDQADVVLPYPLLYEPDINMHHHRYIKDADWNAMLIAVREIHPEYSDAMDVILRQKYLYNYNVILARKEVLREYCEWLFQILERTEELSMPKGCDRSDRYIGYMGETLETLYFMKNSDKLKIVHTGCKMHI